MELPNQSTWNYPDAEKYLKIEELKQQIIRLQNELSWRIAYVPKEDYRGWNVAEIY